jgi:hypothetical protein
MFNSLRDELDKISLMESDDLEYYNDYTVDGDEGAADDELYDDLEEGEEEEDFDDLDDGEAINEAIDMIINEMLVNESYDDYESDDYDYDYDDYDYYNESDDEDDDFDDTEFDDDYDSDEFEDDDDEVDMDYGVVGDGKSVKGDPNDDEYDEVDIGGVTNSIHGDVDLKEDIDDDEDDDLDELLEAICGDECSNAIRANAHDIYGDSADMPDDDVPPAPQYSKLYARNKIGGVYDNYGRDDYNTFGKNCFSRDVMNSMTVDDDAYDEEGNDYDLYASAGNIYDDDENEEYYGIRNKVQTKNLFGRHNIDNINYAQLGDRFSGTGDALDESIATFLSSLD